jgi:hypothetical protein
VPNLWDIACNVTAYVRDAARELDEAVVEWRAQSVVSALGAGRRLTPLEIHRIEKAFPELKIVRLGAMRSPDVCGTSKAPDGWCCSRDRGHDGPCAARELVRDRERA